jgi:predicted O-methyltransferase YrrM
MNSSYKNQDIDYGELIEAITISQNPNSIIEIGILDGYSLQHFINSTHPNKTTIKAYDIFDKFNGNHAKEAELKERFKNDPQVSISYGDFYELHKELDNNIDMIHIDIANNGDTYEYAIQHYLPKLSATGLMLLEGGSKERDEIEWMNKYNKSKINPILQKYSKDYTIKTFGKHPSLTLISLPR